MEYPFIAITLRSILTGGGQIELFDHLTVYKQMILNWIISVT